eukprot:TRINITY_DN3568_c0_g1_i1.p1 TRINITY_DN3568_c0_g1~~TRINITY_DN3568_c0_g1_i1.p1  ORF type:complete len:118 (-),score=19.82 TRINITY_DN3568_c0_g1_i1:248-601(-)
MNDGKRERKKTKETKETKKRRLSRRIDSPTALLDIRQRTQRLPSTHHAHTPRKKNIFKQPHFQSCHKREKEKKREKEQGKIKRKRKQTLLQILPTDKQMIEIKKRPVKFRVNIDNNK